MITVTRIDSAGSPHRVEIGAHRLTIDFTPPPGGSSAGPDPHDLYDSALAGCKALTMLWYAQAKGWALRGIEVTVERDNRRERAGVYALHTRLRIDGELTEAQRTTLLGVAAKCPVHKLMTEVETVVTTELV